MVGLYARRVMYCVYCLQWVNSMADAGANQYTFHLEATEDVGACIRHVREAGMKVGSRDYISYYRVSRLHYFSFLLQQ